MAVSSGTQRGTLRELLTWMGVCQMAFRSEMPTPRRGCGRLPARRRRSLGPRRRPPRKASVAAIFAVRRTPTPWRALLRGGDARRVGMPRLRRGPAGRMGVRAEVRRPRWTIPTRTWISGIWRVMREMLPTRVRRLHPVTMCRRERRRLTAPRRALPRRSYLRLRAGAGVRDRSAGQWTGRSRLRQNPGSFSQIT